MNKRDIETTLLNARRVWVEIWNGKPGTSIYKNGETLRALKSPFRRLMLEPKPGEPVIHVTTGISGMITGISLVEKNYLNSRRYYFVELHEFTPIGISMQLFKETYGTKIKKDALGKPRPKHYPFIAKGDGSVSLAEGYLKEATKPLVEMIIDAIDGIDGIDELQFDLNELDARTDIPETTKKVMRDARCGQGRYRNDLDQIWNSKCAVLGYQTRELRRAVSDHPDPSSREAKRRGDPAVCTAALDSFGFASH